MTLRRPSAVPVAHPIIHPALVVCMCGRGRVCVLAHEDAVWCRGTSCVHQVWTCAGGWRRIYTWEYFFTCLLGFYIFAIARRLYRIHDIGPARRPERARDADGGREQDAPPGGRGGVEPGTGRTSRDLHHGTKRTVSSRAECTGILLVRLVVLRRAELLTPAGAADADARVTRPKHLG